LRLADVPYGTLLEKNYDKALSLNNHYSFINAHILPLLSKDEGNLLTEFEDHCKELHPDAIQCRVDQDAYAMFPKLGKFRMLQRMNPFDGFEGSTKHQMLLSIAMVQLGSEIDKAVVPSGILMGNSLFHNPKRSEIQQRALEQIWRGEKIGGICITEPERGSDAVNMQMQAKIADDGTITYNGTKVYTTNGAVADYLTCYGVTDESDPRRSMMLTLFRRGDPGLKTERLSIPSIPTLGVAKVIYENATVSADRMVAPPGEGYRRLFRGLTPERIAILSSGVGDIWGSLASGVIFSQIRYQFGSSLFKYQGITRVLCDLYAKAASFTAFANQITEIYDHKVGAKIHRGETPDAMDESTLAVMASQGKYIAGKLMHETVYEVAQIMGGRGTLKEPATNNYIGTEELIMDLAEVVGGARNVQMMIMEMGMRGTSAMSLTSFIDKSEKNQQKENQHLTEMMLQKAEKMLADPTQVKNMKETKDQLELVVKKLKTAIEQNNRIEIGAYSKALPFALTAASKAIYKAIKPNEESIPE
jgi:alkylation response protein AidB-like acyl-CoA dehydrogenase